MIPIKDLLNKIKWDKRENPDDYAIFYLDKIANKLIEIRYNDIKRIEGTFMVIDKDNEETYIPMHRIKKVKNKDKIVWSR